MASFLLLCPAPAHAQGGVPLWTNRYDGSANYQDVANAVAVDSNGNVFVTGFSHPGGSGQDFATIKYSSAGVPLWTNFSALGSDEAIAMAIDSSGNVFVTGTSQTFSGLPDYATVAYSNSGVPLWSNLYDGPDSRGDYSRFIAVDSTGNVFVNGTSYLAFGSGTDFATIAYSNAGDLLWINRYDGPANGNDYGGGVAVDHSGNVFVTGSENAGGTSGDGVTIAYSNTGVPLWTNHYNGPANSDDGFGLIAVDSRGNVFVSGSSRGIGSGPDFATIKYSNDGVPLWTNRYNGPGNGEDGGVAIALDSSGNVFVSGRSTGIGSSQDYATIKYSSSGVPLWTNRYNGDSPSGIAVDSSGNVFVTGTSSLAIGSVTDFATIAYSNLGVPLWTNRYNGANGYDQARGIAIDSSGNVFVTGSSWNGTNYDYVTIKYSSSVPPPRLAFQKLNNELVLSWTNVGFNLQTAPAVTGPFTNLPGATSPSTNPLTAPQQFFRLKGD